jgi:hypothetical protein
VTLLLVLSGLALIGVATTDALTTTVSLGSGAGPVTRVVSRSVWAVARAAWPHRHGALRRAGVAVLLCSILGWIVLVWAGWSLVFSAAEAAVVDAVTGAPASVEQRIYFAGYTLLTLGNGDFRPDGPLWRMATVLAAGNGFGLVTLSISYLVPVVSAATEKRQLAAHLHALTRLREARIPTVDDTVFADAVHRLAERRRRLLGLVQHDAWTWDDIAR